ncbi:MAG: hypothetical protein PVI90_01605 [Desulfobacteraceae bacterium]|jgi:hypothetical protein
MNEIGEALAILSTGLKALAEGINVVSKQVNQLTVNQSQTTAKNTSKRAYQSSPTKTQITKKKQSKKAIKKDISSQKINTKKNKTASETVLDLIKNSNDGVNYAHIVKNTGYNKKKIANIFFNLKKQGKIKSVSKGVYTIA